MSRMDRLPAVPLIASDPYLSIWMPADTMTETESCHWCGPQKPLHGVMQVDGEGYRFLGVTREPAAQLTSLAVTPTKTCFVAQAGGVQLETSFITPALPQDLDLMSMPITLVRFRLSSVDGATHQVKLNLHVSDRLCYNGDIRPKMVGAELKLNGLEAAWCGQAIQKPLSHSADRICIDWGYLFLTGDGHVQAAGDGMSLSWEGESQGEVRAVIGYDDIASINYFGDLCKAWYRRGGAQITDALKRAVDEYDQIVADCEALDQQVQADALKAGGEDYVKIICAAWRHTLCAHKLIATPKGEMAFLSKENDSNGCLGTVDVSYPSIPMFLKYNPELVNALCRPALEFASMPVWTEDFAPHDVGRYPYAMGQAYASKWIAIQPETYPPYYLFPAGTDVYDPYKQMPVEESGNMLVMLAAAIHYGADRSLVETYRPLLDEWVKYLIEYGEDPGEQLCTDDFAGHLAHNVNLAAKAIVGVACYGRITGDKAWEEYAKGMAARLMEKIGMEGNTPLTLDGRGWSMKYNLLWDKVLKLDLMPERFYEAEIRSYLPRLNRYGLPLDSRADYTKSDWMCWVAALAEDMAARQAILAPIARMLEETTTRVPFSDWYDTKTGLFEYFIGRSVQGGLYMPMIAMSK